MPDPLHNPTDLEAVLDGLDPDAIRTELDALDRRAAALRVMLRAAHLHRKNRPAGRRPTRAEEAAR